MFLETWWNYFLKYFDFSSAWEKAIFEISLLPIFLLVLGIELVLTQRRQSSVHKAMGLKTTHAWDVVSLVFFVCGMRRLLSNVFLFGFIAFLMEATSGPVRGVFEGVSLWAQLPLALVIHDFSMYWSHRLKHWSPWLWNVHEFHHSATEITMFTDFRVHPLDFVVYYVTTFVPIYFLFGLNPVFYMAFRTIYSLPGYFIHSRIDTDLGVVGKIFISPRFHHLHHEIDDSKNCNFSNGLIIWDRMFGTYKAPHKSIFEMKHGIESNDYDQKLSWRPYMASVFNFYKYPLQKIKGQNIIISRGSTEKDTPSA